jgi:membrane-bound lytic murein transglycosylase B
MERLAKDGVDRLYLRGLFGRLGDVYSPVPMGKKINELFLNKYMSAPRKAPTPGGAPAVYKSLLLPASVEKCKLYLVAHERAFTAMEARYGVPRGIVAGLLMVETRLGSYVGENSAFWSLACLAASDSPERVQTVVQELPLPMTPDKEEWLAALLKARSAWAYKELLALISHSRDQDADPLSVPGSIYGAIGLCQFMPSNLRLFAVDGNNDGKVDLFDPEDAIPSVANYLKLHGWEGTGRETRHASLKRYNKSNIYANTILALGEAIVSPAETAAGGAKAAPVTAAAGKKTAPAKVTVGKKTVPVTAAAGKTVAPGAQKAQGKSQAQAPGKTPGKVPGKAPGKTPGKSSGAGKDGRGKVETPRAAPSSIKS